MKKWARKYDNPVRIQYYTQSWEKMYGYENWTVKKAEHKRIDAFKLWCWRRLLRIPWTARRSNQLILKEISPEYSLEGLMLKRKLQNSGHLMGSCWERLQGGWGFQASSNLVMYRKVGFSSLTSGARMNYWLLSPEPSWSQWGNQDRVLIVHFLRLPPMLWRTQTLSSILVGSHDISIIPLLAFITLFFNLFIFSFIFISCRLITSQHFSGFCHTLTWISHGFACVPHPDPPSHLPLHPIPLGLPSAPGPSTCLMHPTWAGDLFCYR